MATIRTERLLLRPARPGDLAAMHAILSDREAMRWWSTEPHATVEETRAWLDAMIATAPQDGEDFIIEHGGRVIGKAGLYRFPEAGVILSRAAWGQGFAREALAFVLQRAFVVHKLEQITTDIDPLNAASLRLFAALGFVETGRAARTWFIGGGWHDSVYLRLTRDRLPLAPPRSCR